MSPNETSTTTLLARYVSGTVTAPEEAELERRAQSDPTLAAALTGLYEHPAADHANHVARMLAAARASSHEGEKGARPRVQSGGRGQAPALRAMVDRPPAERPARVRPPGWWVRRLGAAAAILLIFGALFLLPTLSNNTDATAAAIESVPEPASSPDAARQPIPAPTEPPSDAAAAVASESFPDADGDDPVIRSTSPAPAGSREVAQAPVDERVSANRINPGTDDLPPRGSNSDVTDSEVLANEPTPEALPPPPPPPAPEEVALEEEAGSLPPPATESPVAPASAPVQTRPSSRDKKSTSQPGYPADKREQFPPAARSEKLLTVYSGRVTATDGRPIIGATVKLPGMALGETTDSSGVFKLTVGQPLTELVISAAGYETETFDVPRDVGDLQLALEPEAPPLDYMDSWSVVRIDLDEDANPGYAKPEEGFAALRRRLETEAPADLPRGKYRFSFSVDPAGNLYGYEFRRRTPRSVRNYLETSLGQTTSWKVEISEEPVRVYLKVRLQ